MSWIAIGISVVAVILFIIAIIVDFVAADQAARRDHSGANTSALAAAWLTIIATVLVIVGLVWLYFSAATTKSGAIAQGLQLAELAAA